MKLEYHQDHHPPRRSNTEHILDWFARSNGCGLQCRMTKDQHLMPLVMSDPPPLPQIRSSSDSWATGQHSMNFYSLVLQSKQPSIYSLSQWPEHLSIRGFGDMTWILEVDWDAEGYSTHCSLRWLWLEMLIEDRRAGSNLYLGYARKSRCEDIRVLILILWQSLIRFSPDSPGKQSMD